MSNIIATLARHTVSNSAICLLTITGGVLLFGAGAYRVFIRPDLLASEAFTLLWPYCCAGVAAIALAWWFDRVGG